MPNLQTCCATLTDQTMFASEWTGSSFVPDAQAEQFSLFPGTSRDDCAILLRYANCPRLDLHVQSSVQESAQGQQVRGPKLRNVQDILECHWQPLPPIVCFALNVSFSDSFNCAVIADPDLDCRRQRAKRLEPMLVPCHVLRCP